MSLPSLVSLPPTTDTATDERYSTTLSVYIGQALDNKKYYGGDAGGYGFGTFDRYLAFHVQRAGKLKDFFDERKFGVLEKKKLKNAVGASHGTAKRLARENFEFADERVKIIDDVVEAVKRL